MKKSGGPALLAALLLALGCVGMAHAEIIPPYSPGQQIGYPAAVLCEALPLLEEPGASARAVQILSYGDRPIVVGADQPTGAMEENGFVYCVLGDSEEAPCGWISADRIIINPAWYVTEKDTEVYAWDDPAAPKVALLSRDVRLPILKEAGGCYLVGLRGGVGWIHM